MSVRDEPTPHFQPVLNQTSYGGPELIVRVLFSLGCFNHPDRCPDCGSPVRLEITTTKKENDAETRLYTTARLRCRLKKCNNSVSLFEDTIWKEIGDRTVFLFTVDAFINRWRTTSVAELTGYREDAISRYLRFIKNAIHFEIEEAIKDFVVGGENERVRTDESHVFSLKAAFWDSHRMVGSSASSRTSPTARSSSRW